jgi:uncharacterized Zn finger protein
MDYGWKPYVPVAARRQKAGQALAKLRKKGETPSGVVINGLTIAKTFWGKAWCDNLERYSDYENRLPRGRTYVRNGSVVDLRIAPGEVTALVSGSSLYTVKAQFSPVPKSRWSAIRDDCAGAIDSLVELLQGRFSKGVMERICREGAGLFPAPKEITFTCSCPDWAAMCKHVAAVLYGIGARLDHSPEVLFVLRQVDHNELIVAAGKNVALGAKGPAVGKRLDDTGLAELFGIELASPAAVPETGAKKHATKKKPASATEKKARSKRPSVSKAGARGRKAGSSRRKPTAADKGANTLRGRRRIDSSA